MGWYEGGERRDGKGQTVFAPPPPPPKLIGGGGWPPLPTLMHTKIKLQIIANICIW